MFELLGRAGASCRWFCAAPCMAATSRHQALGLVHPNRRYLDEACCSPHKPLLAIHSGIECHEKEARRCEADTAEASRTLCWGGVPKAGATRTRMWQAAADRTGDVERTVNDPVPHGLCGLRLVCWEALCLQPQETHAF